MVLIDYWVTSLKEQMLSYLQQYNIKFVGIDPSINCTIPRKSPGQYRLRDRAAKILAFQKQAAAHKERIQSIQSSYLSASEKAEENKTLSVRSDRLLNQGTRKKSLLIKAT